MKQLVILVAVVCGAIGLWYGLHAGKHHAGTPTASGPATMPVTVYFYKGAGLVPYKVDVPRTTAVATASVRALVAGAPAGYTTAIPSGLRLEHLTIAAGTARARFSQEIETAPRTARAQIVYTLTRFPSVQNVVIDTSASPASPPLPASRAEYADLTPSAPIFVATPLRGSTIVGPVHVSGTASVFEATFAVEVRAGSKVIATDSITASEGAPGRGTFEKTLSLPPGSYDLVFFEPSAADGSHLHETTVPVTVVG